MSFVGTITGRLGAKPEARQAGDSQVCTLSVATNKKTRDGDQTLWVKVELWGKQCDYATRYLDKGAFVVCHGWRIVEKLCANPLGALTSPMSAP